MENHQVVHTMFETGRETDAWMYHCYAECVCGDVLEFYTERWETNPAIERRTKSILKEHRKQRMSETMLGGKDVQGQLASTISPTQTPVDYRIMNDGMDAMIEPDEAQLWHGG